MPRYVAEDHPAARGELEEQRAAEADRGADEDADCEISERTRERRRRIRDGVGDGTGDEEGHERCGDAVVQPALDVQDPAHPRRHVRVLDDLRAERRVGRGDRRRDHRRGPGVEVREQDDRQAGAHGDGERESDDQEPQWHTRVVTQHTEVHARRVGEEQERERDLRQAPERVPAHVDVDGGERIVREHEPDGHERHRGAHVERLELRRDEAPGDERRRDGHDQSRVETFHLLLLCVVRSTSSEVAPRAAVVATIIRRGTRVVVTQNA